jgi:hypothetical protein
MIGKEPVPAVRPASRGRTAPLAFEIEATRIARVNPRTGREIPLPVPVAPAGGPAPDPDATIIGAVPATGGARRPVTAEVVPPRDARLSSEVTAAWADEISHGPGRLLRRLRGLPRRVVVLPAAIALGLVLAAAVLNAGRSEPTASGDQAPTDAAPTPGQPISASDEGKAPSSARPEPVGATSVDDPEALGALAAGALADGRLEEARGLYGSLVAADPQRRVWSLAVEILDAAGAGR